MVLSLGEHAALVVVDLQSGTIGASSMAHPADEVIGNADRLLSAFRERGLPVVLVTNAGTAPGRTSYADGGQDWPAARSALVPGLSTASTDIRLTKRAWGAFGRTDLDPRLRSAGTTSVVLAGVATSYGVESTARAGYDLGYSVVVVSDAVTDVTLEGHEHSLARVVPALGLVAATREVLVALGGQSAR